MLNNKDVQNKEIIKIHDFVESNVTPRIESVSDSETINKFRNSLDSEIKLFKSKLQRKLYEVIDNISLRLKNIYNKKESDSLFIKKETKELYVNRSDKWIVNKKQILKDNAFLNITNRTDTIMLMNGVKFVIDGNIIKFINPDGSEMYSYDPETETQRVNGKEVVSLTEKIVSAGAWKIIPNSSADQLNQKIMLPNYFNDLMIVYFRGLDNIYYPPKGPTYEQLCRAELPIKFYTIYGKLGINVTKEYVQITAKDPGMFAPNFPDNLGSKEGLKSYPVKILKVLYR